MNATMARLIRFLLPQSSKLHASKYFGSSVKGTTLLLTSSSPLCIHSLQSYKTVMSKSLPPYLVRAFSNSCAHCSSMSSIQDETVADAKREHLPGRAASDCTEHSDRLEEARKEVTNLLAIGWQAPESISDEDLEHYLTLTTKKGRKKFLRFLCQKAALKKKDKLKRAERARQRAKLKEKEGEREEDDVFENRILLRLQSNTIQQFEKGRLAAGMKFGSKIVFDFSYEELMRRQEVISLVQQLMYGLNGNKCAKDPFDIHWVGLTESTESLRQLKRMMKDSLERTMVNITDKDLLDVFPKEDLIYLSADSPNILTAYDPDKVYVIGALVDSHIIYTGQSLARAKRHGIEHARLPLDRHLQWTTGAKNLTLDQMMKIMIEISTSGDWVRALEHVPTRKHAGLRSGPHWDREAAQQSGPKKRQLDGIQKNPSHFVSSRAGQSKARHQGKLSDRRKTSSTKSSLDEDEDDTAGTVFTARGRGQSDWFD